MPDFPGSQVSYFIPAKEKQMDEFENSPKFQRMRNQIHSLKEDNKILEKSNNYLEDQNQALRKNYAAVKRDLREIQCGLFEILNPNIDRKQATGEITRLMSDVAKYVGGLEEKVIRSRNKKQPNDIIQIINDSIVKEEILGHEYTHYVYDENVAKAIIKLVKRVEKLEKNNAHY